MFPKNTISRNRDIQSARSDSPHRRVFTDRSEAPHSKRLKRKEECKEPDATSEVRGGLCIEPPTQPPLSIAQLRLFLILGFLPFCRTGSPPSLPLWSTSGVHSGFVAWRLRRFCQRHFASGPEILQLLSSEAVALELLSLAQWIPFPTKIPDSCITVEAIIPAEGIQRSGPHCLSVVVTKVNPSLCAMVASDAKERYNAFWKNSSLGPKPFVRDSRTSSLASEPGSRLHVDKQTEYADFNLWATKDAVKNSPSTIARRSYLVLGIGSGVEIERLKHITNWTIKSPYVNKLFQGLSKGLTIRKSRFKAFERPDFGCRRISSIVPISLGNVWPAHRQAPLELRDKGGRMVESRVQTIEDLLSVPSARNLKTIESGAELWDLLSAPTAKHTITALGFKNQGGSRVHEICVHGTRLECLQASATSHSFAIQRQLNTSSTDVMRQRPAACTKVHFKRILLPHTDVALGDCSYLDTCRHKNTCRFVHYEVDHELVSNNDSLTGNERTEYDIGTVGLTDEKDAQWITCDIRKFDYTMFRGKVRVVMADPPWDIHMDLPYGTMSDAEMKSIPLGDVQDEGCLFLWVTGRAMELGRECMKLWGYRQVEEIVWVKTNQLHRIIRTGRTGHWLNHSKEHCLVGIKGCPKLNKALDTDIIVAEVRETSRKPDEIYRIIERLCPGPYKLELFGRPHNVRNNWITLGNQLDGVQLHDPQIISCYNRVAASQNMPEYKTDQLEEV